MTTEKSPAKRGRVKADPVPQTEKDFKTAQPGDPLEQKSREFQQAIKDHVDFERGETVEMATGQVIETRPRTAKCKEFLPYHFREDEMLDKGKEMARISSEVTALQNEKKAVMADFKAKIDKKNAEIGLLGEHINNGYEHRYIDCTMTYNTPNTGMKTITRNDTGEIVRKLTMTADEMQLDFEFEQEGVRDPEREEAMPDGKSQAAGE